MTISWLDLQCLGELLVADDEGVGEGLAHGPNEVSPLVVGEVGQVLRPRRSDFTEDAIAPQRPEQADVCDRQERVPHAHLVQHACIEHGLERHRPSLEVGCNS